MDMKDSDDISESENRKQKLGEFLELFIRILFRILGDVIVLSPDNRYISDTIIVSLIPEKKGTFLKHTEYEVSNEEKSTHDWWLSVFIILDNVWEA